MNHSLRVTMLIGIFVTWLSSASISFSTPTTVKIQPRDEAFIIWALIFSSLVGSSYKIGDESVFETQSAILLITSIYLLVAWSFAVYKQKWWIAAVILVITSTLGWVSCYRYNLTNSIWGWVGLFSLGIFVGWLSVATALNIAIVYPKVDTPQTLFVISIIVSILSVICKQPFACLSIFWAIIMQKENTVWKLVSGILTVVFGYISYSRINT